jgi:hypothetical protein
LAETRIIASGIALALESKGFFDCSNSGMALSESYRFSANRKIQILKEAITFAQSRIHNSQARRISFPRTNPLKFT